MHGWCSILRHRSFSDQLRSYYVVKCSSLWKLEPLLMSANKRHIHYIDCPICKGSAPPTMIKIAPRDVASNTSSQRIRVRHCLSCWSRYRSTLQSQVDTLSICPATRFNLQYRRTFRRPNQFVDRQMQITRCHQNLRHCHCELFCLLGSNNIQSVHA